MVSLKQKIIKKAYFLARKHIKHILTNKLGKVVEKENEIVCYVDRKKIEKVNNIYIISCLGAKSNEELANAYDLNKHIHYIIDNLEFSKNQVLIFGHDDCYVEINNCVFDRGCNIHVNGTCVLEKTKISDFNSLDIWATNLRLINMHLDKIPYCESNFCLSVGALENLDLFATTIGPRNKKLYIYFNANEVNIISSKIHGFKIDCEAQKIKMDEDSRFIATDFVNIKTSDLEKLTIESPKVIYNEVNVSNNTNVVTLEKITDPLKLKRMELVNVLRQLKSKCDEEKLNNLNKCEESLNKKSLARLLKK